MEDLLGSWEWISTRLSADNIVTPATEGHTLTLELTAEGVATWFKDGVLTRVETFTATGGNSGEITFEEQGPWSYSFTGSTREELLLNESQTAAGPYHHYGRAGTVSTQPETWGRLKTRFDAP